MEKLRYEYGLELTFRPPERWPECVTRAQWRAVFRKLPKPNRLDIWDGFERSAIGRFVSTELSARLAKLFRSMPEHMFRRDEIEFHSPVLDDMNKIHAFYSAVCDVITPLGPRAHSDQIVSGGGHLHVTPRGKGRWRSAFVREVFRDATNRPYLNWVFNDPEDDQNASTMLASNDLNEFCDHTDYSAAVHRKLWAKNKDYALSHSADQGRGTIEFRFFDAPRGWDEQRLHVLFVDHWLSWLEKRWRAGNRTPLRYRWEWELKKLTLKQCTAEFNGMLDEIGLPRAPYQHFLENMRTRYREGLRRD